METVPSMDWSMRFCFLFPFPVSIWQTGGAVKAIPSLKSGKFREKNHIKEKIKSKFVFTGIFPRRGIQRNYAGRPVLRRRAVDGTASCENQIRVDSTGGEMPMHSMAAFFAMFSYFFFWLFVFRGMKHYAADFSFPSNTLWQTNKFIKFHSLDDKKNT